MPVHKIEMSQPSKAVLHNDVTFEIFSDEEKLGTLKVSKGGADWTPSRRHNAKTITWETFAKAMDALYEGKRLR
jgi:hypothetical protein